MIKFAERDRCAEAYGDVHSGDDGMMLRSLRILHKSCAGRQAAIIANIAFMQEIYPCVCVGDVYVCTPGV